jgi:hypothetical protein
MTATTPLFVHRLWTVVPGEDDTFDVIDHDGDVVDGAYTLEDATEACRAGADESYRARVWEAIQGADPEEVSIENLELAARLIGLDPGKL